MFNQMSSPLWNSITPGSPLIGVVLPIGILPEIRSKYNRQKITGGSDGTPHKWVIPTNESTTFPEGISVHGVPNVPATQANPADKN